MENKYKVKVKINHFLQIQLHLFLGKEYYHLYLKELLDLNLILTQDLQRENDLNLRQCVADKILNKIDYFEHELRQDPLNSKRLK